MSEPDGIPFRGSLLQDPRDVRVTRRCLAEDLGLADDAEMAEVVALPIGRFAPALTQARSLLEIPGLGALPGCEAASWLDPQRPVSWLVAVAPAGEAVEDHCRRIAREGRLLPDPVDLRGADADTLAGLLHGARIQAPLLSKRAREAPGVPQALWLGIRPMIEARLAYDETTGESLLRLPRQLPPLHGMHESRLMAALLCSFHADDRWIPVDDDASPDHLTFRHRAADA